MPKARKVNAAKRIARPQTSAGKARAEGLRLFKVAGRPSKQDFVKVYDPNGPKMTWEPFKTSTTSEPPSLKIEPLPKYACRLRTDQKGVLSMAEKENIQLADKGSRL